MKKIRVLLIALLTCSLLNGCFNYVDINNVVFVTSLIIDIDEAGMTTIYAEAFHSFRSYETNTEKGERLFYTTTGDTLFQAIRGLNTVASYKLNYSQNKAIIFTERAARQGITEYLDFLHRDQELLLRSYIIVYQGSNPMELVTMDLKENEYMGLFLFEMLENPSIGARKIHERINRYLNNRLKGKGVDLVTYIKINDNTAEKKLQVEGAAIMVEDTMIDSLTAEEVMSYHLLMDTLEGGLILLPHPSFPDKKVVLEILQGKANTKTEIALQDEGITLKKSISIRASFGETQESITLDTQQLQKIKESAEEILRGDTEVLFNKYKDRGIDIFRVNDQLKKKYTRQDIENPIEVTDLIVEAEVFIEGSANITGFE